MKQLLLVTAFFCCSYISAQTTITSTTDGNANNPFIWDCLCFPTPDDDVIVNHDVVMNVDWIINAGGSITISASGSFIEDANNRSILVDGAGSAFNNNGFTELTSMAFTNGAEGTNTSDFLLDTVLYIGNNSSFTNSGVIVGTDSVLVNGILINILGADLALGDFWNNGTMTNAGTIFADSLLNTGTFNSTGIIYCLDFGNNGPFTQSAEFFVESNFYNADDITLASSAVLLVGNDMLTGDSLGGSASIINDGAVSVGNDFLNTDQLSGSGRYCITNSSTNMGDVTGTLDICDQSPGGGFDVNLGTVAGTVTFCSSACNVGVEELAATEILIYPNPASESFTIEYSEQVKGKLTFELYNLLGELVLSDILSNTSNLINISSLNSGVYMCKVSDEFGSITTERLVKE
ncbi:MAG: T9SS type A sorting domain-containing protein [Crocinitomicaceae bacterium]